MQTKAENLTGPVQVLAISPGVAIGPAHIFKPAETSIEITQIEPGQVEAEQLGLQKALQQAITELDRLRQEVARKVGPEEAAIFEAQQMMLKDPDLLAEAQNLITVGHFSAGAALKQAAEQQAELLEKLDHTALAARAADLRDATARVIQFLLKPGSAGQKQAATDKPIILVAYDLTPSDTANLDSEVILGICTVVGGPTTHAAILARALEIPAVAGLDPAMLNSLANGQLIGIDGGQGRLYLEPDQPQRETLESQMRQQTAQRQAQRSRQQQWRNQPATTADGQRVEVFANVGDLSSVQKAAEVGAEGIGLLRTEFLFNDRPIFPDEQEQFESYAVLFEAFAKNTLFSKTIIARTLDAGADKPVPGLEPLIGAQKEANPALGLRGARLHLVHEELLLQQLRALLRAAIATGIELQIMFPMITTLEEVRRLKASYLRARTSLEKAGETIPAQVRVGIMVETPAAALMAPVLAREVDFLSIGANDLYQYTLVADRTNQQVAALFARLEPAVWRSIYGIVQAGLSQQKPVAVCGELAADPQIGPLLVGLGVQELSMSPAAIGRLKTALHEHPLEYWQATALKLLAAETAAEMQQILAQ